MPKYTTVIKTSGPDGNIHAMLAAATCYLRMLEGESAKTTETIVGLRNRVLNAEGHEEARNHIREYFPLEGD